MLSIDFFSVSLIAKSDRGLLAWNLEHINDDAWPFYPLRCDPSFTYTLPDLRWIAVYLEVC
jgi:hypothetical protein